ncbi:YbgC/FadM family acyl-CoA thioesterase [Nitratiruptor sp. SB155-2]|uniref:YbgC/FadM family acyl-CoA thioesterase n=1 Tax=Nitratiruptor sp. (strain SB155-2) TaxID=387092 RepID=UPI000158724A|nr:YbgC/FadM family acyl-CoA thioesterase [Nitratiruptor sp. SB155-2]BAF69799.1 thioesterase family protein [Nitratiruptor sp. SB155-2]
MKIRVYYEDVDIGGVVYHSKYLNFCERARSELFFENRKSPVYKEYHFVVKELKASYLKPAFFGDLLEVKTQLQQTKGARIQLLQTVCKDEDPIFKIEIELVCMKGLKPAKIPHYFLEVFDR